MKIIVGTVVRKDNKYLLVQEAQESCRGKWNIPAGHLDEGESILDGAIRETREETGINVTLTGLISIDNLASRQGIVLIFSAEVESGDIHINPAEILDVEWLSLEEIKSLDLRGPHILDSILKSEEGIQYPLSIIQELEK